LASDVIQYLSVSTTATSSSWIRAFTSRDSSDLPDPLAPTIATTTTVEHDIVVLATRREN
jgi:hypothetical protein